MNPLLRVLKIEDVGSVRGAFFEVELFGIDQGGFVFQYRLILNNPPATIDHYALLPCEVRFKGTSRECFVIPL